MQRPTALDWVLLAALVVAWGISFSMTKVAVSQMDPVWVMALRLAVGAAVLLVYALASRVALPREMRLWGWFAWLGFIGYVAPFFLISWGTQFITSGLSGVLMGAIPLLVIVMAHYALRDEKLNAMKSVGFVIGFIGLMIVLGVEKLGGFSMDTAALKGELAILLACFCYAIHAISAKRLPFSGPVAQSTAVCLCATVIGVAVAFLASPSGPHTDNHAAYWAVLGLGIVPTGIATVLAYRLIRRCGVSFVAYSNYLVPVFALAFGAITLDERLSWNTAAGLGLILVGIAVSRMPGRR